jgi:hypothetical protein
MISQLWRAKQFAKPLQDAAFYIMHVFQRLFLRKMRHKKALVSKRKAKVFCCFLLRPALQEKGFFFFSYFLHALRLVNAFFAFKKVSASACIPVL